jgi:hypothetical protein
MIVVQECLILVAEVTLQVCNLLAYDTILLGQTTDLLVEVRNLLGIATKTTQLCNNDALGVVLQLEQVLGIAHHVRPTTVVVDLIDVACLIHVSLPLQVGAVLNRVQRDGRTHSGR